MLFHTDAKRTRLGASHHIKPKEVGYGEVLRVDVFCIQLYAPPKANSIFGRKVKKACRSVLDIKTVNFLCRSEDTREIAHVAPESLY